MMAVLHQVSPAFKAISSEIAAKAFGISKDVRNDDAALLRTIRGTFMYLGHLAARFRHPSEWSSVSFQTIDCSATSFVFAYALYLSCTSLRRNATRSSCGVFESTHAVILTALEQSEALRAQVIPAEITWLLKESTDQERELAFLGLDLVQGFGDLHHYGDAFALFQQNVEKDGTGPLTGACHFVHTALSKVEGAYEKYESNLNRNPSQLDPHAYELPGFDRCLQRLTTLTIDEDKYNLRERIELWSRTSTKTHSAGE